MKFRSGSEKKVYEFFKSKKIKVKYEPEKFKYEWHEHKTYCPDFMLPNNTYIEVKGRLTIEMRKKHLFFRISNPDINQEEEEDNGELEEGQEADIAQVNEIDNLLRISKSERTLQTL